MNERYRDITKNARKNEDNIHSAVEFLSTCPRRLVVDFHPPTVHSTPGFSHRHPQNGPVNPQPVGTYNAQARGATVSSLRASVRSAPGERQLARGDVINWRVEDVAEPNPPEACKRIEHALIWVNHADAGKCTLDEAHQAIRELLSKALDFLDAA